MKPAGKEKNGPVEEKLPQTYWGGGAGKLSSEQYENQ